MQHEVVERQDLLDKRGHIVEQGWARHPVWNYSRRAIKANALRIKEWDYYAILSPELGFALGITFSDLGFAGLLAVACMDLVRGKSVQVDALVPLTLGKLALGKDSGDHAVSWSSEKLRIALSRKHEQRRILVGCPQMRLPDGRVGLDADITLVQQPNLQSINIATSWAENRKAFYLNEKINCMPATGRIRREHDTTDLAGTHTYGSLDWGRGRWTYRNRWYWGSASSELDGVPFGFNIGYGFTDRSPASENAIFHQGILHKLDQVTFHIPKDSYMAPWKFSSNDNRFTMDFKPIVDRSSSTNLLLIRSEQHQVFGLFSGHAVLDDGTVLEVRDMLGFAEDVYNRF